MTPRGAYYNEFDPHAAQWLRCRACKTEKNHGEFSADSSNKSGKRSTCKACCAAAAVARRLANPEKHRNAAKSYRDKNLARELVRGAAKRAAKKEIDFDLDGHIDSIQRRIDLGLCEATGLPFQLGRGHHWASPSIDRIKSNGPYCYSNIRLVLHGYNNAIGNWGEDVLFSMVDACRSKK